MRELQESDVKALSEAAGLKVPQEDLYVLTVRLNGMIEMSRILETLPLQDVEPLPILLMQKEG
jgi:hypothetical protein